MRHPCYWCAVATILAVGNPAAAADPFDGTGIVAEDVVALTRDKGAAEDGRDQHNQYGKTHR